MRRFLAKILWLSPLPIGVMLSNYLVDPAHLYGVREAESTVAKELAGGRAVEVDTFLDEPLLQARFARAAGKARQVLVLGSSRAMPLAGDSFPGKTFFNASVSSAALEDYLALDQLYQENRMEPSLLVLGLDPWILDGTLRNPSRSLEPELDRALAKLGVSASRPKAGRPRPPNRYLELLSPGYFQVSLAAWWRGGPRRGEVGGPPVGSADQRRTIFPDGSSEWSPAVLSRTVEEVRALAARFGRQPPGYLRSTSPDPRLKRVLAAFLDALHAKGVSVIFFLAPYHPIAYREILAVSPMIQESELYLRELAASRGIDVVGSYDPGRCAVAEDEFVDFHHLRRSGMQHVWRR